MLYATYGKLQWDIAYITLFLAVITIGWFAWKPPRASFWIAVVIVLWGLLPPIWFFGEYYAVDHDWFTSLPEEKDDLLESVKTYADYASKIWGAVLAAVLFLVKKE